MKDCTLTCGNIGKYLAGRNFMNCRSGAVMAMSLVFLTSCTESVLTSSAIQSPTTRPPYLIDMKRQCGSNDSSIIYSLPRALLPLNVKFGNAVRTPSRAQSAKMASLEADIKSLQARIKNAPAAEVIALRTLITESRAALAKLQGSFARTGFNVTIGTPVMLPDPSRTYALCYNPSAFSDDDLTIKGSASGLLSEIAITADDRADDVVRKVAEGVVEVAKLASLVGTPGLRSQSDPTGTRTRDDLALCTGEKNFAFSVLIDPTNVTQSKEVIAKALRDRGVPQSCLTFDAQDVPQSNGTAAPVFDDPSEVTRLCSQGACYRRAWPVVFTVTEKSTSQGSSFVAQIPNSGPIGVVDFKRALFVKVEASAKFDQGMLTSFTYKKPSEVLAVASLPVDVLKSLVSIPTAAFETQAGQLEAAAELVTAQAALQSAEAGLEPGDAETIQGLKDEIEILKLESERDALRDAAAAE